MSLHEDLIAELLSGKVSLSPRENAAVNEIVSLRAQLAAAGKRDVPVEKPSKVKHE
jgi:hypothetical protein